MAKHPTVVNEKDNWMDTPGMKNALEEDVPYVANVLRGEKLIPVMLVAPTGSGKRYVQRRILEAAGFSEKDVLIINCAAMTEQLLESELYGHVKGAFTGATQPNPGALGSGKSVIVLDEINSLPQTAQAKLLTYLDDGVYREVGGNRNLQAKCKILGMCNADRPEDKFRADFLYRFELIHIPPIHRRRTDILVFLKEWCPDIMWRRRDLITLMAYEWPGNVRQLWFFARNVNRCFEATRGKEYVDDSFAYYENPKFLPYGISDPAMLRGVPHDFLISELIEPLNRDVPHLSARIKELCPLIWEGYSDERVDLRVIQDTNCDFPMDREIALDNPDREHYLAAWQRDWETLCLLFRQPGVSASNILVDIHERNDPIDDIYKHLWLIRSVCRDARILQLLLDLTGYRYPDEDNQEDEEEDPISPKQTPVRDEKPRSFEAAFDQICEQLHPGQFKELWIRRLVDRGVKSADVEAKFGLDSKKVDRWFRDYKKKFKIEAQ